MHDYCDNVENAYSIFHGKHIYFKTFLVLLIGVCFSNCVVNSNIFDTLPFFHYKFNISESFHFNEYVYKRGLLSVTLCPRRDATLEKQSLLTYDDVYILLLPETQVIFLD